MLFFLVLFFLLSSL
jgi:hypothetical protein